MSDELRAAAERLRKLRDVSGNVLNSPYADDALNRHSIQQRTDLAIVANSYLDHIPLTRERVAAAVAELFVSMNTKADRLLFADANNEGLGIWWREKGLTDRLCRLLGVEDK